MNEKEKCELVENEVVSNEISIFENKEFGNIRTVLIDDKPYFVASDVAKALGYANPSRSVNDHCRNIKKDALPIR